MNDLRSTYRRLGRTGLSICPVGFGTYRVDDETPAHRAALEMALQRGCNLIDTSTNYTDGGSERCIGAVLAEGDPSIRDATVVVSKVGYVQGANLMEAMKRERDGKPFPEMVKYMQGCWHCLHPEFIERQLSLSLDRLRRRTLDVYLLHNPEYFLMDAAKRGSGGTLEERREIFYDRIRRAFERLEIEVAAGRIRHYGVSSNTFGDLPTDPHATLVSRMWEIAEGLKGKDHHFSVIQLPLNLFESGPALNKVEGPQALSALAFAEKIGLGVLINRPLNAIVGPQLVRLANGQPVSEQVSRHLDTYLPLALHSQSLSRKALAVVLNTKGVTCVLNGMRDPTYVADALGAINFDAFEVPEALYRSFLSASNQA